MKKPNYRDFNGNIEGYYEAVCEYAIVGDESSNEDSDANCEDWEEDDH